MAVGPGEPVDVGVGVGVGVAVGAAVGGGVGRPGVMAVPARMPAQIGNVLLEDSWIAFPMMPPMIGVSGLKVHDSATVASWPAPAELGAAGSPEG